MLIREATPGETLAYDPDRTELSARASWMRDPGRAFVAVVDGVVAGSAFVHPNHPGNGARGIGRALCAHVLESARSDGYRAMQFNAVVETNTRAVRLWQSFGF